LGIVDCSFGHGWEIVVMARVLVIDDEEMLLETIVKFLRRYDYVAEGVSTLVEGVEKARRGNFDVILLDVEMPDGCGLEYIPELKEVRSNPEVIIITGKGTEDGAEQAIMSGAWSYISKPDLLRDLLLYVTRALQYREERCRSVAPVSLKREAIIGESRELGQCLKQVVLAASSDASVLITGETGTGKELFARAVHDNSRRAGGNFVVVDCAALPENLIESTLFGHVRGAFTGAEKNRDGLVRLADGGTLFLDEVGELPLSIQKTFLRVLQEHSFRPVGSLKEEKSDFRIIAATNRDLELSVDRGEFRSDLFFRLQTFTLRIPPLRQRKDDIRPLAKHFMARLCERFQIPTKVISPEFFEHLEGYDWPGNVRQLQHTLEQVFAGAVHQPTLFENHLPEYLRIRQIQAGLATDMVPDGVGDVSRSFPDAVSPPPPWQKFKKSVERQYIINLMAYSRGKIKLACEVSGLSRARIYQLREKYGLISNSE
jgi:two-component system NtrC family response regulator